MVACANCSAFRPALSRPHGFQEVCIVDACHQHAYSIPPIHSLSTFFDTHSFFNEPTISLALTPDLLPDMQDCFNPTLSASIISTPNTTASPDAAPQQCSDPASFGSLYQSSSTLLINPSVESAHVPLDVKCSSVPSLCGDAIEASISPRTSKCQPLSSSVGCENEFVSKRPLRKRGRPRLDRSNRAETPSASSEKQHKPCCSRVPHNQVERKYREGLNSEIEKLRRAVPTLLQSNDVGVIGQPKPSKATVIAAAVEYIKSTERERDALRKEVERTKYTKAKPR